MQKTCAEEGDPTGPVSSTCLSRGGMQGESLPLWGTVGQLMDQLTAAGVGERPVVFVCHRWAQT